MPPGVLEREREREREREGERDSGRVIMQLHERGGLYTTPGLCQDASACVWLVGIARWM